MSGQGEVRAKNPNCLSYWYPYLDGRVPTPKTAIIDVAFNLTEAIDVRQQTGDVSHDLAALLDEIMVRAVMVCDLPMTVGAKATVNVPFFLRTGQGSGKHDWKDTCYVSPQDNLLNHVAALVEWSHAVDMLGLPLDVMVVRAMLPTKPIAFLPAYGDMPLVREFRGFVRDGAVVCVHPYWPQGAIANGLRDVSMRSRRDVPWLQKQKRYAEDAQASMFYAKLAYEVPAIATDLLHEVAKIFKGIGPGEAAWSVDVLEAEDGWYVTDMATAHRSYHDPECQHRFAAPAILPPGDYVLPVPVPFDPNAVVPLLELAPVALPSGLLSSGLLSSGPRSSGPLPPAMLPSNPRPHGQE